MDRWNETTVGWPGPKPGEPADPAFIEAGKAMPFPGVAILAGLPGSGKSYMASVLRRIYAGPQARALTHGRAAVEVVSSDHFWAPDYSDFDPAKLPQAHQACYRDFLTATMMERAPMVVVDNTNISSAEVAPYYLAGEALGYQVSLLRINVTPEVALARNIHGVPAEIVDKMNAAWLRRDVMPWWNVVEVAALHPAKPA